MIKPNYDIVIIGAGLVGASLAVSLINEPANQHLSIALIERGDAPSVFSLNNEAPVFDPRVVALTQASIGLFEAIGVWDSVLSKRVCPYRDMCVWDDEGTGSIHFNAQELGQNQLGVIVENQWLLQALLERLTASAQVDVIRGSGVEAFSLHQTQQQVTLSNEQTVRGTLLIAADGGQSKIRELANMPTRAWNYQHKAIVTTVKTAHQHQYTAWQNFLSTGPLAFLPLADSSEQYSSIVWSAENERADELMAMDVDAFKHALGRAFHYRLGDIVDTAERFCFPLVQRHAVEYIAPQLALVGDAAHTIHPLAGQGVNLGLLDVCALSQEITRASSRQLLLSDMSILRRYQRQRKKNNLEIMLLMEGFKRLFGRRDLPVRWLRNQGLKSVDGIKPLKSWMAKQAMGL